MRSLFLLLFAAFTVHALPTDCIQLTAGGEALYWKPCSTDFHYGLRFQGLATTTRRQLIFNPDYGWGFRAFTKATDRCDINFLILDWTYIQLSSSTQVSGPNSGSNDENLLLVYRLNLGAATQALEANANERHKYSKVSLRAGHTFFDSRCGRIYGYFGGRWVDLRERKESRSVGFLPNTDVITKQVSEFDGGGIEVGFGGETTPVCGFGATGRIGIAALIGEQKSSAFSTRGQQVVVNECDPTQTICLPAMELRGGLFAVLGCKCVNVRAEVGYQLDYYFNILHIRLPQADPNDLFSSNLGFGGPYISIQASF